METILLTGATGFLGSHLLEHFNGQGYHVVILKRSTSDTWRINHLINKVDVYDIDKIDFKAVFETTKIDVIINTVCNYGRKNESLIDVINANLIFGLNLMEEGIRHNVKTFINTDSLLPRNLNDYSLSKAQFADWLQKYSDRIQVVNLKMEHMYGPKDDDKKFIPWLIHEMVKGKEDIKLTSGIQKRDFIYISDVIAAYDIVFKQKDKLGSWSQLDVGSNSLITVKALVLQLAEKIQSLKGIEILSRLKFGSIPYRSLEVMEPIVDNRQLCSLGWLPKVSLEQGIKQCIYSID